VGDLVGFRNGTGDTTVRVTACSRMTLTALTIFNASGFTAVAEALGGELGPNHYSSITVKRGPRPPGASTGPLFTTLGGLDSTEARNGPDVENCYFESMPDDGIAVSGYHGAELKRHLGHNHENYGDRHPMTPELRSQLEIQHQQRYSRKPAGSLARLVLANFRAFHAPGLFRKSQRHYLV
jgi:hypothetical protein